MAYSVVDIFITGLLTFVAAVFGYYMIMRIYSKAKQNQYKVEKACTKGVSNSLLESKTSEKQGQIEHSLGTTPRGTKDASKEENSTSSVEHAIEQRYIYMYVCLQQLIGSTVVNI